MWPLVLAGVVGSALGFGAGYAMAIRDRPSAGTNGESAAAGSRSGAGVQPEAREFTEGSVEPANSGPGPLKPDAADSQTTDAKTSPAGAARPSATVTAPVARPAAPLSPPASKPPAAGAPGVPFGAPLFAGRVLVRSTPSGARVFVDGKSGGETPATVRDLARGAHQVRLVREGYTTVERRIVITASKPALTLTVEMVKVPVVPARLESALVVESRPAGAAVFLDGRQIGTTPLTQPGVQVGAHAVRIVLDGYRPWSASIQVVASDQNRVAASLER